MLHDFIASHRATIIANAAARVAGRTCPKPSALELSHGIPMFLSQLCEALQLAQASDLIDHEPIDRAARIHGQDLLRDGFTIGQVVHDYGDICQTITELAVRLGVDIGTREFRTLNLCLDDAIAGAVSGYAKQRERTLTAESTERLGVLAHELHNALNSATLAFASIQSGRVSAGGPTAHVLGRSLASLRVVIDRSLAEVRLEASLQQFAPLVVADLIEELEIGALIQAQARGHQFVSHSLDRSVIVHGDRHILVSALSNLLENAFKFTQDHTLVQLTASATRERVTFSVEDECGGLSEGQAELLLRPFEQASANHTGLGLGLFICVEAARAHGGEVQVRNLPGHGCVISLDLPRAWSESGDGAA